MSRALLLLLLAGLMAAPSLHARKEVVRRKVNPAARVETAPTVTRLEDADSLILLSGYDKPLRARREVLFVTSSLPDTIAGVEVELTYTDASGHRLHKRSVTLLSPIPPGETRRVDFPSWDTQCSFYYIEGRPPSRASGTPYRLRVTVTGIITE